MHRKAGSAVTLATCTTFENNHSVLPLFFEDRWWISQWKRVSSALQYKETKNTDEGPTKEKTHFKAEFKVNARKSKIFGLPLFMKC